MDWQALMLSPQGRIPRSSFWIGFGAVFVGSLVANLIPVIGPLLGLFLLWPQVCIHAKRLHDMGRSAVLILIPFAVTIVCFGGAVVLGGIGMIMGAVGDDTNVAANVLGLLPALGLLAFAGLVGLAFLLWVGLTPGEPGPNRFGEAPAKGPAL